LNGIGFAGCNGRPVWSCLADPAVIRRVGLLNSLEDVERYSSSREQFARIVRTR